MAKRPRDQQIEEAIERFKGFQRKNPRAIGDFPETMTMPTHARCLGKAVHVLYQSDKVDPETLEQPAEPINYIHEHDAGVRVYQPRHTKLPWLSGKSFEVVPDELQVDGLVLLGDCLGLAYVDDEGVDYALEADDDPPELYCIPSGKALVVVQDKREILYLVWGGALGVEPRGIVG